MSNAEKTKQDTDVPAGSSPKNASQTPENVMVLNSESEARDLNFRLKAMENTLQNLNHHLETSQNTMAKSLEQILNDVKDNIQKGTDEVRSEARSEIRFETKDVRVKLGYLEGSYQSLEEKSATLAKETARLTLQLDKNAQSQTDAVQSLEQNTSANVIKISGEIESLDQQVEQLINDYTTLSMESQTLIGQLSEKTDGLEQTFSDHEGHFKKLAQDIETRNKQVDSRLEQVNHNFAFHDAKIMKLHEKDTELETHNQSLKELLLQSETEHKHQIASLEQKLESKITSVSEDVEHKHQTLSSEQQNLEQKASDIEAKTEQLDTEFKTVNEKHQRQFSEHDERIDIHNTNLHSHETKLEQLQSVDEELSKRAQGLKETTKLLNEQSQALEKTTVSLQEQSDELQGAVVQLNKQNELLEEKTDDLGLSIATNAQTERQHFQKMTMAISIVAIVTIIALIYSFINQQNLWQSSMDNDVAVERRLNLQLSEQKNQLTQVEQNLVQAEQHRAQLTDTVFLLQKQLQEEKAKAEGLMKDSEEKTSKLLELKGEVEEIDGNVQFLNTSVGPLKDYSRYTGKELLDSSWLAQQPESYYAIQLISVDSKSKLYQYIGDNGYSLINDLAWFTISSKGKDYYVLTYGSYEKLAQARAALSQLPSQIAQQSPGISQLKDIQSFIN